VNPGAGIHRPFRSERHTASLDGFSLHAGVRIHEHDREGLERLCRYAVRPPFALQRRSRRLTQAATVQLFGIDQPEVSELLRGRLTRFSTEPLLAFLLRLGRDVDIEVRGAGGARRAHRATRWD
jgi:hypothetical protein